MSGVPCYAKPSVFMTMMCALIYLGLRIWRIGGIHQDGLVSKILGSKSSNGLMACLWRLLIQERVTTRYLSLVMARSRYLTSVYLPPASLSIARTQRKCKKSKLNSGEVVAGPHIHRPISLVTFFLCTMAPVSPPSSPRRLPPSRVTATCCGSAYYMLIALKRKTLFLKISERSRPNTTLYLHLFPPLRPHPCHLRHHPLPPPTRKYTIFPQGLTKPTCQETENRIWKCLTPTPEATFLISLPSV